MKVRIKDLPGFSSGVFGADCFLENFPEIQTTGVHVRPALSGSHYVFSVYDPETGKSYHSTTFFSMEEMQYMECVDDPTHVFEISGEEKKQLDEEYRRQAAAYDAFMAAYSHLFK